MPEIAPAPLFRDLDAAGRGEADSAGADWHARWIVAFLVLGVTIRTARYLLRFPLWGDESLLAVNFLDRGFADLLRPLDNIQIAPLGFLMVEHATTLLLGFSEWSLRLFPFVCSIASLFVFHRLAKLVFRGEAVVLAVGIFAVSYPGLRYSAEVKPYGVDLFVSTVLLTLTAAWWRRQDQARWLWALAAFVPLALALSYPSVFVAGGTSIAVAVLLYSRRHRRGWLPWAIYNLTLVTTFAGLYALSIHGQEQASLAVQQECWKHDFPPWNSPGRLVYWLLYAHAGPLVGQPVGGDNFASLGTSLLCIAAVAALWRGRHRWFLLFCASPFALNLAAAALRRYPYGGHMRMTMHLMPLVCLLAGFGAATLLRRPPRLRFGLQCVARPELRAKGVLIGLVLLGTALMARDCWTQCKDVQNLWMRDFARWFWTGMSRDCELVCIETDLGEKFPAAPFYLCNQRIYSPRHARGEPPRLERVSPSRPLACVQYWWRQHPYDPSAFNRWLQRMQQTYDLVGCEQYPQRNDADGDVGGELPDRVEVYRFVPKRPEQRAATLVGLRPRLSPK